MGEFINYTTIQMNNKKFKVLITTECEVELPIESSDPKIIMTAFKKLDADFQSEFTRISLREFQAKVLKEND